MAGLDPFEHSEQFSRMILNLPEDNEVKSTPKKPIKKRLFFLTFVTSVIILIGMNSTEVLISVLNWDTLNCIKNSTMQF